MKKFLSLVLSLAMTLSLVTIGASATDYKDLTDKSEIQYEEAVAVLNKIGIITGYEDGSFKPTGALTRGAAAKIIVSLMIGSDAASALTVTAAPYKDVPVTNTFAAVISYCKTAGYINGYTDGTFRPTAALTGYAFTKMLLGALGYDGTQEGFTGSGWTMNVAKLGNTAGLFNDFATAFSGNAGVDRESACLLALNTLKATEVQYSGGTSITTTTGNATTNVVTKQERSYKTSNNSKINQNIGKNKDNLSAEYTLEFGEEHFTDLKLTAEGNAEDDFGRPSNEWSYKNSKIGTYAQTADYTYTTGADGDTDADMVKDMGLKDYKVPETTYTVNGKSVPFKATTNAGKLAEIANLTDNGVLVEAYMDDDNADTIDAFVVVYSQIMQVNAVRSNEVTLKNVEDIYLNSSTYDSDSPNVDFPSVSSVTSIKDDDDAWANVKDLKADDFVVVVPVKDGSSYRVFSAVAPQTVTGSLTNIKVNSGNSSVKAVTVAGTAYSMSKLWTSEDKELKTTTTLSSKVDTTVMLDSYGYVIYAKDVTASNSAIIIDEIYSSLVDGKIVKYAKGWDSTGNAIELNLGTSPSYPGAADETAAQGMVYEYKTATANNAEYQLTKADDVRNTGDSALVYSYANAPKISNGQYSAAVTSTGTDATKPFASDVKFIFVSSEGNAVGTDVTGITVKTGVSEVTALTGGATMTYVLNKDCTKIVAVVIPNDDDAGNTANLLFFQKVTNHINNADGKRVAIFTAYVNGEKLTDLQLNKDIDDGDNNNMFYTYSKNESTGVYSLTPYTKTAKITSVKTKITPADTAFTDVENYYYKAEELSNVVLNAKNATVVDLYTDDGITFNSVKEIKDAIHEGRASNFKISYAYNGDKDNSGYNTISYLFIYENSYTQAVSAYYNVAATDGLLFSQDATHYYSSLSSVATGKTISVKAVSGDLATLTKSGTALTVAGGVGTFTLTADVAANVFTFTKADQAMSVTKSASISGLTLNMNVYDVTPGNSQICDDAEIYLTNQGWTVTNIKASESPNEFEFTAVKDGSTRTFDTVTTVVYKVTLDDVVSYKASGDVVSVATASGSTGFIATANGTTDYQDYGDYTMTAHDTVIKTGYVDVTAINVADTELASNFNVKYVVDDAAATATKPDYLKAGSVLKIQLIAQGAVTLDGTTTNATLVFTGATASPSLSVTLATGTATFAESPAKTFTANEGAAAMAADDMIVVTYAAATASVDTTLDFTAAT